MTNDEVRTWLLDFQRRTDHHNAAGCVVCCTINMLIAELYSNRPVDRRVVDGVVIIGPET